MPADSGQATSLGNQVREEITPRAKRLMIIMAVTPWLVALVYYGFPYLNSQTRHLEAVARHIEKIQPQWNLFRAEHNGFERVEFSAYTGGDGEFSAEGSVPSQAHVEQLRSFIVGTSPPRPLFFKALLVMSEADLELLSTNNASMAPHFADSAQAEDLAFQIKLAILEAMEITQVPRREQRTSAFISLEQNEVEKFRKYFNGNERVEVAAEPNESFKNLTQTNQIFLDKRNGAPALYVYIKIVEIGPNAAEAEVTDMMPGSFVIEGFKLKFENGKWQVVKRWVVGIS
jgi:hypothetical protein